MNEMTVDRGVDPGVCELAATASVVIDVRPSTGIADTRYNGAMESASALLRRSRAEAGLTQVAVAELARIPQSVISDYERGRREPSFAALSKLLSVMGFRLASVPESAALTEVRRHAEPLRRGFEDLGASNIAVFGSVARGSDRADSDIDLLVDLDPSVGVFALTRMRSLAEELLGRPVDVVPRDGLKPEVKRTAELEEIPL